MIFESLVLRDVGAYGGEQRIDFAPPSASQPVTLIGGLNGAGKTTLMRSLFHVLYGPHALPLIERRGSYERYLRDAMRTGAAEASIELRFSIPAVEGSTQITVCRSWTERRGKMKETVDAYRDGQYDEALSETWVSFVEGLAPRGVARLFFFDGEKVEALADLEEAKATLRTAVGALLGLDLVDQLIGDLTVVERRKAVAVVPSEARARLGQLEEEWATSRELFTEAVREQTAANDAVRRAEEQRGHIVDAYRAAGGDVFDQREQLRGEAQAASHELMSAEDSAREIASRDATPLLLIADQVHALSERSIWARENADRVRLSSALEQRDAALLEHVRSLSVAPADIDALADFLQTDRAARADGVDVDHASSELARLADELRQRSGELTAVREVVDEVLADLDRRKQLFDERQSAIAQIPADDAIQGLERDREEAEVRLSDARGQRDSADLVVEQRRRMTEAAEAQVQRELRRIADVEIDDLEAKRIMEHAERARATLRDFRQSAAKQHLGRIAELATEALGQLLHKDRLIQALEIDTETYELTLKASGGTTLEPYQLSAGERQLTALAILWALARASGRPLPVVVDTPLGRLDASHRAHVVGRYLPFASEQVVVLSTDTEIEGELHELLLPHIGRSYALNYDAASDATRIEPGYLGLSLSS